MHVRAMKARRPGCAAVLGAGMLASASAGAQATGTQATDTQATGAQATGTPTAGAQATGPQTTGALAPEPSRYSQALLGEVAAGFVPYANDVPLMVGVGVRAASVHEVWLRLGYMPVGDDAGYGFGVVGYRAVLRPGRVVRPVVGAYFAGLPATCGHDDAGRQSCTPDTLFIWSATGGVRFEPHPAIGLSALLSLGVDSYPNPFGMVEIAATFALPLPR